MRCRPAYARAYDWLIRRARARSHTRARALDLARSRSNARSLVHAHLVVAVLLLLLLFVDDVLLRLIRTASRADRLRANATLSPPRSPRARGGAARTMLLLLRAKRLPRGRQCASPRRADGTSKLRRARVTTTSAARARRRGARPWYLPGGPSSPSIHDVC